MVDLNPNDGNILHLPDEVLLIIFEKLAMINVLSTLANVNRRFFRLAIDPVYVQDLNLSMKSFHGRRISSIDSEAVSRICETILPLIEHQVSKLTIEEEFMKEVLAAGTYSTLHSLILSSFQESMLHQYLTNDPTLCDLLRKQIIHLSIINIRRTIDDFGRTLAKIFSLILSLCPKLTVLDLDDNDPVPKGWFTMSFIRRETWTYSNLIKLKINVQFFNDCLYLLDGRLDCLSTLIISVNNIHGLIPCTVKTKKACQLKCFSLTSVHSIVEYDELIVPLLSQMTNVEELHLCLLITRFNSTYIDGNDFSEQFLISMRKLKQFTFNIWTKVQNYCDSQIELTTIEDIQLSFLGKGYSPVISKLHRCLKNNGITETSMCHIYTLPFQFEYFLYLDNCFEGGKFNTVRYLKMEDRTAFEYQFFQIISRDFPSLQHLDFHNLQSQANKQYSSVLLSFPSLVHLDIYHAHLDYVELFLLKSNTYLPRLSSLSIKSKSLMEITNGFTKHFKHFHLNSLKNLDVRNEMFIHSKKFHEYFPLL